MITREQLREHIARRPFTPFRILLVGGEPLDVTRLNQVVAMTTRMIFVTPEDRLRWVPFANVDQIQVLKPMAA